MTTITHQTTNMTQPPILRTYKMNMRVVGSKTMVVMVTPLLGRKEVTCLLSTNQYSNEVDNLGMIHVLVVFALRFSHGVLCWCSVSTLRNEINCLFKFILIISSLPTSRAIGSRITSQSKLTTPCNLHISGKKMFHQQNWHWIDNSQSLFKSESYNGRLLHQVAG